MILFAVLVTVSCANSDFGYSEEVHTSFKAGPGFSAFGRIYYLVNYRLFRTPRGIMRFPDGGQSRFVHRGTYVMAASYPDRPQVIMKLPAELENTGIAGTHGTKDNRTLILEVRGLRDAETHSIVITETTAQYQQRAMIPAASLLLEPDWDMTQTNDSLRRYSAADIGLPSPLDYCDKSPGAYRKDVVKLRGDFPYRREIIKYLDLRGETALELLQDMDDYEDGLTGYERDEYRFIAEDTRAALKGATDD